MRSVFLASAVAAVALFGSNSVAPAAVIFADFGTDLSPTPPWNNNVASGSNVALLDTAGAATGASVIASGFGGSGSGGNSTGFTGDALTAFGAAYPTASIDYSFTNGGTTGTLSFAGLDPAAKYTFTAYGARNNGNTTLFSTYTATGAAGSTATGSLQTYRSTGVNTDQVVVLPNITPTGTGTISFTVANATGFAYINALRIDSVIPEPATLAAVAGAAATLLRRRRRA